MDQNTAKKLFNEGAFLLLLDVPEGTEFGIDWNSWTTGPQFKGVKMIPPGVHFVFYSAMSTYDGNIAPRTGFFHCFRPHEILVRKWCKSTEELLEEAKSDEEIENIRSSLMDLDKNLGAYPYESLKKWVSMSNNITPELVKRLSPENLVIHSVLEMIADNDDEAGTSTQDGATKRARRTDKDGLPCMKANPTSVIRFTKIPEKWYPDGSSPSEITKHSMDSTHIFNVMVKNYEKTFDILGELQFTFLCFVLGQVFDAFEHWKKLLHVLCSCETALQDNVDLYKALIGVLYHQINEIPQDFFVDIVTSNNFLVTTLTILFSSIEMSCFNEELQNRAQQFRKHLTKKFKWKFNSVPDDWAPVVVEL